jgi:hypothetical protein
MKYALLTGLLLVSLPSFASAATFAKQSLFLSKTPVTEGETVLIHAVVANESNVKFDGQVVFSIKDPTGGWTDNQKIASVAVSIAPGGANAVSVSWKPAAGSPIVLAELTAPDGTIVESESSVFTIDKKQQPGSTSSTNSIDSSKDIQDKIAGFVPAAAPVSQPIFATLDSARAAAAGGLDNAIAWTKQLTKAKNPGEILGTTTSNTVKAGNTIWTVLATILLYIFSVLRFAVGNAGIFYPAFALLFFYILWRIYKRMRRPAYPAY